MKSPLQTEHNGALQPLFRSESPPCVIVRGRQHIERLFRAQIGQEPGFAVTGEEHLFVYLDIQLAAEFAKVLDGKHMPVRRFVP